MASHPLERRLRACARYGAVLVACLIATSGLARRAPGQEIPSFTESAASLQIAHFWGPGLFGGNFGGGVAIEDFDGDGDQDLFLGNIAGQSLDVYRNDGASFTRISDSVGIGDVGLSKQLLFADFDEDGHRDLLIAGWDTPLLLYRNDGDGSFTEISTLGGVLEGPATGEPTGACVADYDRDGDVDLYLAVWKDGVFGPESENVLYRNDGGFVFVDVTAAAGVGDQRKSYQPVFADLNDDRWPDLLVAEDKGGGLRYFENDRDGSFTERTAESGLDGFVESDDSFVDGMGLTVEDFDNDGRLDVYATSINNGHVMYLNLGGGLFDEVAEARGTIGRRYSWAASFFDADNDGWLDLFVACFNGIAIPAPNLFFWNNGNGFFTEVAVAAGLADSSPSYVSAVGDLDSDGDLDLVLTNESTLTRVYLNDGNDHHWLRLRLRGVQTNRDGIGARVFVSTGALRQTRELRCGTGYLGHDSLELEFGLGDATQIDTLEILWPTGAVDSFTNVAVDREYLIVEGAVAPLSTRVRRFVARVLGPSRVRLDWDTIGDGDLGLWRAGRASAQATLVAEGLGASGWLEDKPPEGGPWRYELRDSAQSLATAELRLELPGARATLGSPIPNPFNPRMSIVLSVPAAAAGEWGRVGVVDSRGRRVTSLFRGPLEAGERSLEWAGLDERGRAVASGVYHVELRTQSSRTSVPVTLSR